MTSPFEPRSRFGILRAYVFGLGLLSIAACARDATELVGDRALAFDIEDDGRFRVSSVYDRELAAGFLIKGQGRFHGARPTSFNTGHLDVELYDRNGALVDRGILKISLHKAGRRAVPHGHYSGRFAANLTDHVGRHDRGELLFDLRVRQGSSSQPSCYAPLRLATSWVATDRIGSLVLEIRHYR